MKMRITRLALTIILAVSTMNCGEDTIPKYQELDNLRILTIIVDKPEANPGDQVTFTPVLSDLKGNGRTVNYAIQACIDPGVNNGADPVCLNPDPVSIRIGTVTIPAGASRTYTGPVAPFSLTMPDAATIFSGRSVVDQYNGVIYLPEDRDVLGRSMRLTSN